MSDDRGLPDGELPTRDEVIATDDDRVGDDSGTDVRLAELMRIDGAARALAPKLIGLSVQATKDLTAEHPDLTVFFTYPARPYSALRVFGQIGAHVRNGLVVSVS